MSHPWLWLVPATTSFSFMCPCFQSINGNKKNPKKQKERGEEKIDWERKGIVFLSLLRTDDACKCKCSDVKSFIIQSPCKCISARWSRPIISFLYLSKKQASVVCVSKAMEAKERKQHGTERDSVCLCPLCILYCAGKEHICISPSVDNWGEWERNWSMVLVRL